MRLPTLLIFRSFYLSTSDSDECVVSFNSQLHMGANTGSTEHTSHFTPYNLAYRLKLETLSYMASACIWMGYCEPQLHMRANTGSNEYTSHHAPDI